MIRIRQASKHYGSFQAVHDLSLDVGEGETMVLLGTSGSGKTTTLKMINLLIELSAGTIEVAGTDIRQQQPEELRRRMGYVIQGAGLFPHYTVGENVAVVPRLLGWDKEKISEHTSQILPLLGLPPENYLHKFPTQLSGGEQQRVGLARALVADPPVVLMDEPFGALDPITRVRIRREFRHLDVLRRKTVVLVTHDVQEAFELGHRICVMDQGEAQQIGTPQELLFRPANDFVRRFLQDQRFQLQLQVLSLREILPYLPPLPPSSPRSPAPPAVAEITSVLEATQLLAGEQGRGGCLAIQPEAGGTVFLAGLPEIMTAVDRAIQQLFP
ncbi:ABC transporter ATP-binding protein [soil metagenome]